MTTKIQEIIKNGNKDYNSLEFFNFVDNKNIDSWQNDKRLDDIVRLSRFRDTEWLMSDLNTEYITSKITFNKVAEMTKYKKGYIVEVCSGPTGGFGPGYLISNPNAKVIISDISPYLMNLWFLMLKETQYKNATAMSFNICNMPFKDNTIDIVSSRYGLINIENNTGNYKEALKECYRVLNKDGLLIINELKLTDECVNKLTDDQIIVLKQRYSNIFVDLHNDLNELGFSIEFYQNVSKWNNASDDSSLATLCRNWNISLDFYDYLIICKKG